MDTSKKVSVLLTVYNKPKWLRQCIDSVVDQTYPNWELVIMEDNSPNPEVKEILYSYLSHPQIHVVFSEVSEEDRYKTARYATLINQGFYYSDGDYITYLTDDDFYFPERLAVMVEALSASDVHVVYGPQQTVDADGNFGSVRWTSGLRYGKAGDPTEAFNHVDHNSVMHTREAFVRAGGWYDDPGVWGGADAYFWRRLTEAGYVFYPVSEDKPLDAKRYHTDAVQWRVHNGVFYPHDRQRQGLPLDTEKK